MDEDRVTTIVLAAAANVVLTDIATAKSELGIEEADTSRDVWLARGLRQVSGTIRNYCNRVFAVQQYQDTFWLRAHFWGGNIHSNSHGSEVHDFEPLMLAKVPLVAIDSVVDFDGNVLVEGTDFEV